MDRGVCAIVASRITHFKMATSTSYTRHARLVLLLNRRRIKSRIANSQGILVIITGDFDLKAKHELRNKTFDYMFAPISNASVTLPLRRPLGTLAGKTFWGH